MAVEYNETLWPDNNSSDVLRIFKNFDDQTTGDYGTGNSTVVHPDFVTLPTHVNAYNDTLNLNVYTARLYSLDAAKLADRHVSFVILAVVIPALCVLGLLFNVLTIVLLRHSAFRSLSSLLIHTAVVSDTVLLVAVTLKTVPGALLRHYHPRYPLPSPAEPWPLLAAVQILFVVATPLGSLARDVDLWCVASIVLEQYALIRRPTWLTRRDNLEFGIRVAATIITAGILGNMPEFFKYTRRSIFYGAETIQQKVCLAENYRTRSSQLYDRYISFAIFTIIPLVLLFYLLSYIVAKAIGVVRSRRAGDIWEMEEEELVRIFEGVRSTKLVLTIGLAGFCLHCSSSALYLVSVKRLGDDESDYAAADCHIIPVEVKFDYVAADAGEMVLVYDAVDAVIGSTKFLFVCFGLREFRRAVRKAASKKWIWTKTVCRCLVPRRSVGSRSDPSITPSAAADEAGESSSTKKESSKSANH